MEHHCIMSKYCVSHKVRYDTLRSIVLFVIFSSITIIVSGCSHREVKDLEYESTHGPVMISTVEPIYPEEAEKKGVEGTVVIKLWVDSTGTATMALIQESPDHALDVSATNAALATKFKPALLDGKPVGVWFTVPFEVKKK